MAAAHRRALFSSLGFKDQFVEDLLKNAKKSDLLERVLNDAGALNGTSPEHGKLINELVSKLEDPSEFASAHIGSVVVKDYILTGKIASQPQVLAAVDYLKKETKKFDQKAFEAKCGVGVVVTEKDIRAALDAEIAEVKDALVAERYQFDAMSILRNVRAKLPWADGKLVVTLHKNAIEGLLGPKTEQDEELAKAAKKGKGGKKAAVSTPISKSDEKEEKKVDVQEEKWTYEYIMKHYSGRDLPDARNPAELMEQHFKITGGLVRSRFPPEPNGFLHIGHAKAMNFNFGLATKSGGICFLRFDDTNPSAEEQRFIDNIIENVTWLGHKPYDVTFSSDYFPLLHEMAIELIKRGKAYVCHQTQAQIKEFRKKKNRQDPSPWRNRSVEENLKEFENMRKGKYSEGEATLRMKIDITHVNPCMWDPVAYRIKYEPHPHVKDKWCIYPSYDYTHCLVDSIENITNSCCTLEFEIRRDSYYWLLAALDLYRPMVWEYSRLNITHNVLSKRKLKFLVVNNLVRGWDDPRLLTLNGLRRRGFSPEAINDFCTRVGVSRTTVGYTRYDLLEACARQDMDVRCPRTMVVLEPLKVVIDNWDKKAAVESVEAMNFPKEKERGTHKVSLSAVVFIEKSDFRTVDDADFYGLAPGKTVRLKYSYNITCTSFETNQAGEVSVVHVTIDKSNKATKGNLHWVSGPNPLSVEVRVFDYLFTAEFPGSKQAVGEEGGAVAVEAVEEEEEEGGAEGKPEWLKELNPNSEVVYNGVADAHLLSEGALAPGASFQFERLGFFVVDPDSTSKRLVFNRTVGLKSSKE